MKKVSFAAKEFSQKMEELGLKDSFSLKPGEKGIVICIHCKQSIKFIYSFIDQDNSDICDVYVCTSKNCPRLGLASFVYDLIKP